MEDLSYRLALTVLRVRDAWLLELSHVDPTSQARAAPVRGPIALDAAALLALQADDEAYGKALAAQLFADPALLERLLQVQAAAGAASLRLSVRVDPSAQELHALRWELLAHPRTGARFATSEATPLSRFMVSRDWRPVKLRPRSELTAVVAVANPAGERATRLRVAPIDVAGEQGRAAAALGALRPRVLDGPCTLDRLLAALRDGVDVLYLVAHGTFHARTGEPCVLLQGPDGDVERVGGDVIAARVAELLTPPRLIVLASCQSAGDGAAGASPEATLAWRLGDAGVPAVVAMQGSVSMETIERLMPVFFTELLRDGQLDRAMAVARGAVRDRHDAWMPALFTRLEDGRLWYTPGFRGGGGEAVWRQLLPAVRAGKVLPVIGPGALEPVYGSPYDLARRLAERSGFPLAPHEWDDLPRVQQFLGVKESRFNVVAAYKEQMTRQIVERHGAWLPPAMLPPAQPSLPQLLKAVGDRLRASPDDTWALLAELRAPIYLTTTFDPLLGLALRAAGRSPQQVLPRWRHGRAPRSAEEQPVPPASPQAPLVYHAFGAFGKDTDDTLVITEDNHFDYLIDDAAYKLTPPEVAAALVDSSLLFLGFRLTDWSFRVLFRLMMSLPNRARLKDYCHVAVQLDPEMLSMADVDGARRYLADYFGKEANIDIFWGSPQEFLAALHAESARAAPAPAPPPPEDDDAWAF